MKPLCFVLMPFGTKTDKTGRKIDFNNIYEVLIKKAIEACDLEPIRADEELLGGTIHKPMYERLVLCDYAIADLTSLNANVFYELGLRHAIKAHTTIPIFAFDADLPFDLNFQRTLPYKLDKEGKLEDIEASKKMLITHLNSAKGQGNIDSPVFQLIEGWKVSHKLTHEKTDAFREQAIYENDVKEDLSKARNEGKDAVVAMFENLQPINEKSVGVIVDLFISLRGVKAWEEMFECYKSMDAPMQNVKMIREQLGFAYNRAGKQEEAKKILLSLIDTYGFDPETNGILGRVYKDLYFDAKKEGNELKAAGSLIQAIMSYKEGFDADWRDAYPGVNLVTLLELKGDTDMLNQYLPIVQFANNRKMATTSRDYWDLATQGELNILKRDYKTATDNFSEALALIPPNEIWMLETTLNNLKLIREARTEFKTQDEGLNNLLEQLEKYVQSES
jgi:tetratricopeptide (TPR) repeat protein